MRAVYTPHPLYGRAPRAYVRLEVDGRFVLALIDSGADASVLTQTDAALLRIPYRASDPTVGVGGPVTTYRAVAPLTIRIHVPRKRRGQLEWVELGEHTITPAVIPSAVPMPSLVGRIDLLRHYRFCLSERDATFDLLPL